MASLKNGESFTAGDSRFLKNGIRGEEKRREERRGEEKRREGMKERNAFKCVGCGGVPHTLGRPSLAQP